MNELIVKHTQTTVDGRITEDSIDIRYGSCMNSVTFNKNILDKVISKLKEYQ